jgi:hypothetical protein
MLDTTFGSYATITKSRKRNWIGSAGLQYGVRLLRKQVTKSELEEKDIMNAIEARNARKAKRQKNLSQRLREDSDMARRIDAYLEDLRLEQQFIDEMQHEKISAAELARRTKRKPAAISRDLAGGLSSAKLGRVREMAAAIDCDVVAFLVPRDPVRRAEAVGRMTAEAPWMRRNRTPVK